jgi:hypothetical protein
MIVLDRRRSHFKRQSDVCGDGEENGENETCENDVFNEDVDDDDDDDQEEEEEDEYLKGQILLANKNKYSHSSTTTAKEPRSDSIIATSTSTSTVNDTALHDLLSRANLKQYLNAFIEQGKIKQKRFPLSDINTNLIY